MAKAKAKSSTFSIKDMTGRRFGRLTIIVERGRYVYPSGHQTKYFLVRCDCGTEKLIRLNDLSKTRSCGCLQREKASSRKIAMVGRRFGRLLVVKELAPIIRDYGSGPHPTRNFLCRCNCGNNAIVAGGHLRNGHSKSCGCWKKEATGKRALKHGESMPGRVTTEFTTWCGMIQRCRDPNFIGFRYYGGRGIRVCKRWRDSYKAFLDDMGRKPSPKHSIDRLNVDRGYYPANCRWATAKEQEQNKRNKRK